MNEIVGHLSMKHRVHSRRVIALIKKQLLVCHRGHARAAIKLQFYRSDPARS